MVFPLAVGATGLVFLRIFVPKDAGIDAEKTFHQTVLCYDGVRTRVQGKKPMCWFQAKVALMSRKILISKLRK